MQQHNSSVFTVFTSHLARTRGACCLAAALAACGGGGGNGGGTGPADSPAASVSGVGAFVETAVWDSSPPQTLTLANTGKAALSVSSISTTDPAFVIVGGTCSAGASSIAPGASCTVVVNEALRAFNAEFEAELAAIAEEEAILAAAAAARPAARRHASDL